MVNNIFDFKISSVNIFFGASPYFYKPFLQVGSADIVNPFLLAIIKASFKVSQLPLHSAGVIPV
jgi:hypothetical protein